MVINNKVNVQYNGGFLPDILLLTQAPIIVVWFDGIIIVYYHYLFKSYTDTILSGACHYLTNCFQMKTPRSLRGDR